MSQKRGASVALMAAALSIGACTAAPAKAPAPKKPISERRAVEIIARGIAKEKLIADEGRTVRLAGGASVHMDVGVKNRKFGVAYITENDREEPGAERLPRKDPKRPRALVVAEGVGDDSDTKVLLLFDTDYMSDDSVSDYEQTTIAAEVALERDVRDFIVQAKTHRWD